MAENQCLLTSDGRSALDELLKRVYPKSKGSNKSQLERDTGLRRDTLNRILNSPPKPVQKRSLETLFRKLNARLAENYRTQHSPRQGEDATAYEGRMRKESKQCYILFQSTFCTDEIEEQTSQSDKSNLSLNRSNPIPAAISLDRAFSSHQQLDVLLGSLDYTTGQAMFEESMRHLKPVGAFLLQVCDTNVQRWLVKRLAQKVAGFTNAEKLEINVALSGGNFEYIWSQFAEKLKLSSETADSTIEHLSELCREKTVIIVLSRLQQIDEAMQRQLIEEFWLPLVRQICSQQRDWRSRLILFLVQDGAKFGELPSCPFEVVAPDAAKNPECPVRLEPLVQIASYDVQDWFEKDGFELLTTKVGLEAANQFMQQDRIAKWEQHPWATLENICNVFRTEITEIEHYWKLAG